MDSIFLHAHAKINLTLDVLHRRSDGYHAIRSVMQSIGLADRVLLYRSDEGIQLHTNVRVCDDQENLAWRAAELFFRTTGVRGGVRIDLEKHIPLAAGLAGGSADAAAVIWGLNTLFSAGLTRQAMQEIGIRLGADVPFCLQGGTMLAEGIGEDLTPLPTIPPCSLVLAKPEESVSTPHVYQGLHREDFGDRHTSSLVTALQEQGSWYEHLGNALCSVTGNLVPSVPLWQQRMLDAGAAASLMSGSGPTVFGVFWCGQDAQRFCQRWKDAVWLHQTIPVSEGVREKTPMSSDDA